MNPIPLSAPNGLVYAYACGICHEVGSGFQHLGQPDDPVGPDPDLVERSFDESTRCCACLDCGVQLHGQRYGRCPPCEAKHASALDVHRAEMERQHAMYVERLNASLALARDRDAATRLVALMSELSEEHYCAGWLHNLEYELWSIVIGRSSLALGLMDLPEEHLAELRRLSDAAGGWWVWHQADKPGASGELFVTIDNWQVQYRRVCPPRKVVTRSIAPDGTVLGLYDGECCDAGTCTRPPGHEGPHDQFDSPTSSDAVPLHRLLPEEERI